MPPHPVASSAASDQGLHCLPMSHKKEAMLIWVKSHTSRRFYSNLNKNTTQQPLKRKWTGPIDRNEKFHLT